MPPSRAPSALPADRDRDDPIDITGDEHRNASSSQPPSSLSRAHLLPFARSIVRSIVPSADESLDEGDALIILAKGLGMRSIVATILKIYDAPTNLVLIVNARPDEEAGLSEELTSLGVRQPGLRSIGHETNGQKRQNLYHSGGLISLTNRILVGDMLSKLVPTELITGIVVLHAEDTNSPAHQLAFMTNLYRSSNKDGFLKAFSDNAESFATGLSPLQTVMGQLRIRKVELWPRFHKSILRDLGQRKADVVELHQPLTRSMQIIQNAAVECLDATLNEIKRAVGGIDVEHYNIDNAIFKAFDVIVSKQIGPRWASLNNRSKSLVNDLKEIRNILTYLVQYDSISFLEYLNSLVASQQSYLSGANQQNQSPWMFMDAADILLRQAKARVYVGQIENEQQRRERQAMEQEQSAIDVDADPDEEEAAGMRPPAAPAPRARRRPKWLPHGIDPVLEEQPKWHLLRDVLNEIEQDIYFTENKEDVMVPNNTILIMTRGERTCRQVGNFISKMKESIIGQPDQDDDVEEDVQAESSQRPARRMMMHALWKHFNWQRDYSTVSNNLRNGNDQDIATTSNATSTSTPAGTYESDALKRKQIWERGQGPPNKRRRQRGGGMVGSSSTARPTANDPQGQADLLTKEADDMAAFIERASQTVDNVDAEYGPEQNDPQIGSEGPEMGFEYHDEDYDSDNDTSDIDNREDDFTITGDNLDFSEVEFDNYFGVLDMDTLIVVRPYKGDADDYTLSELRPRFIVMYDPDAAFVRRIEMYRAMNSGANPRVYFLLYAASVEEQMYLSSLRREKESFEKLIREKSTMVIPLQADGEPVDSSSSSDGLLRTVNSRIAGGQRGVTKEAPRIIFDVRELGSELPGILYKSGMQVEGVTLQVGDYILSPEMCVERKSIPDLISSFNSGRLYTQAESMSVHYRHPILLIEFASEDNFHMTTFAETRSGNKNKTVTSKTSPKDVDIQTKLVMLTMSFPRLRIIWSSSPWQTSEIFTELKVNYSEPDKSIVSKIGLPPTSADGTTMTGNYETMYNLIPQDLLSCMPGLNSVSVRHVMNSVRDLEELSQLDLKDIQGMIGVEPGRILFAFLQRDTKLRSKKKGLLLK
ncbi:unnamed protein product [Sympodiomycopsis kandeliae]